MNTNEETENTPIIVLATLIGAASWGMLLVGPLGLVAA